VSFEQAENLTKAFHPTPAVCGVPLQKAKEVIAELEPHKRSYYTGYLGIVSPNKELNLFVNLRCLQVLPNRLALYLGGGITANSNAEKEWAETNFKAETLLSELE
jgi:isochorismate synthase